MKYYKFLTEDARGSCSGFNYADYLPKSGKPGKWLPVVKDLRECESGYHSCKASQVSRWINARMFEVEYSGSVGTYSDKVNGHRMRFVREMPGWNERNQRLAACDIAESALPNFENVHPGDPRPRTAIETSRRYASGEAVADELSAAWSAAWSAAESAESKIFLRYAKMRPR